MCHHVSGTPPHRPYHLFVLSPVPCRLASCRFPRCRRCTARTPPSCPLSRWTSRCPPSPEMRPQAAGRGAGAVAAATATAAAASLETRRCSSPCCLTVRGAVGMQAGDIRWPSTRGINCAGQVSLAPPPKPFLPCSCHRPANLRLRPHGMLTLTLTNCGPRRWPALPRHTPGRAAAAGRRGGPV